MNLQIFNAYSDLLFYLGLALDAYLHFLTLISVGICVGVSCFITLQQTSFLKILSAKLLTFEIASAGKDVKTFKLQQQSSRKILPIFSQTNL